MLTFYHAPMSRSDTTFWLLEEMDVPYQMEIVDIRAQGGAPESYRAIQPNKKAPAIDHDGVIITERAAIAAYLCDAFPGAGLAPPIGDPLRGPYLSWLVYVDSVMDPVMVAHSQGWSYPSIGVSYGLYDDMVRNVEATLAKRDYAAGDRFTGADVSLSSAVNWALFAKMLPQTPTLRAYVERTQARPGYKRMMAKRP